jgi:hypothetical protein
MGELQRARFESLNALRRIAIAAEFGRDARMSAATAFAQASKVTEHRHHDRVSRGSLQSEASAAAIARTNRKIQRSGELTPNVSCAKVHGHRRVGVPSARVQQKE